MNYLLAAYFAIGMLYGTWLALRHARDLAEAAVIFAMSTAAWPFLMWVQTRD